MEKEQMFIQASRLKLRFVSDKGQVNVEDLWDLPIVKLQLMASNIRDEIRSEESAVCFTSHGNTKIPELQMRFDIIETIAMTRLTENEQRKEARAAEAEIQVLLDALKDKKTDKIKESSISDIEKRIKKLQKKV